jgi:XTP/dITP diphosphohydrolase
VIDRLVVASKNPDKIAEVEEVLAGLGLVREIVRGLDWPDVEETEPTLAGNALLKAHAVLAATGLTAVADDTGLEVDALGGEPGIYTARYAGPDATYDDNVAKLLEEMEGVRRRSARFKTAVALVDEHGRELTVEGVVEGEITTERRGAGGFGYDPIFSVGGRTFAEMGSEEKHHISHRALALRALAVALGADPERH